MSARSRWSCGCSTATRAVRGAASFSSEPRLSRLKVAMRRRRGVSIMLFPGTRVWSVCRRRLQEVAEFADELHVERPLEGHDQVRQLFEVGPAPGGELGVGAVDVYVRVGPQEAHREPLLPLT